MFYVVVEALVFSIWSKRIQNSIETKHTKFRRELNDVFSTFLKMVSALIVDYSL